MAKDRRRATNPTPPQQFNRHTIPIIADLIGIDFPTFCNRANQSGLFFDRYFSGLEEPRGTDNWEKKLIHKVFSEWHLEHPIGDDRKERFVRWTLGVKQEFPVLCGRNIVEALPC